METPCMVIDTAEEVLRTLPKETVLKLMQRTIINGWCQRNLGNHKFMPIYNTAERASFFAETILTRGFDAVMGLDLDEKWDVVNALVRARAA